MRSAAFAAFFFLLPTLCYAQLIEPEAPSGFHPKPAVESDDFMVVTAHPEASQAARDVIIEGGNALDAAIAAQMVLNVVEPQSSGIGGGGFLLYYDARTKATHAYDGRETSPAAFPADAFMEEKNGSLQKQSFKDALSGAKAVGAPGLLTMLDTAHKAHGKTEWSSLFHRAITLAKDGFAVTPRLRALLDYAPTIHTDFPFKHVYEAENGYTVGDIITNPALANTFTQIAAQGTRPFYHGAIAQQIVAAVNQATPPGYLTLDDLENYRTETREPLCGPFMAYKVCSLPPPSGGITVLQILSLYEASAHGTDLAPSEQWNHLLIATRNAFAVRARVGDPLEMRDSVEELLDIEALSPSEAEDRSQEAPSTTHLSITDREGNIVSMTSSIEHAFGVGEMAGGFFLNNQLTDFDWDATDTANAVRPNRRPRSSMSPTIVFDVDHRPVLVIGSPGGSRIIPYIAKTIIAHLDWGLSLDQAIASPHMVMSPNGRVAYEAAANPALVKALGERDHVLDKKELTSGLHAIAIAYDDEGDAISYVGAADPRREGVALGE